MQATFHSFNEVISLLYSTNFGTRVNYSLPIDIIIAIIAPPKIWALSRPFFFYIQRGKNVKEKTGLATRD